MQLTDKLENLTDFCGKLQDLEKLLTEAKERVHQQWCNLQPVATQEAWEEGTVDLQFLDEVHSSLYDVEGDIGSQFSYTLHQFEHYLDNLNESNE